MYDVLRAGHLSRIGAGAGSYCPAITTGHTTIAIPLPGAGNFIDENARTTHPIRASSFRSVPPFEAVVTVPSRSITNRTESLPPPFTPRSTAASLHVPILPRFPRTTLPTASAVIEPVTLNAPRRTPAGDAPASVCDARADEDAAGSADSDAAADAPAGADDAPAADADGLSDTGAPLLATLETVDVVADTALGTRPSRALSAVTPIAPAATSATPAAAATTVSFVPLLPFIARSRS